MKIELTDHTLYIVKGFYSSYNVALVNNSSGGIIERRGICDTAELLKTLILYIKIVKSS